MARVLVAVKGRALFFYLYLMLPYIALEHREMLIYRYLTDSCNLRLIIVQQFWSSLASTQIAAASSPFAGHLWLDSEFFLFNSANPAILLAVLGIRRVVLHITSSCITHSARQTSKHPHEPPLAFHHQRPPTHIIGYSSLPLVRLVHHVPHPASRGRLPDSKRVQLPTVQYTDRQADTSSM